MAIILPKFAVLDSATLGKASLDYWNQDGKRRARARTFLDRMQERGIHVALSFTQVSELLRHDDDAVVRDRKEFLRRVSLIAWVRPYDRNWFPGSNVDVLCRELHAVVHGSARTWREIIDAVRPELWETGTGADLFVENGPVWSILRAMARREHAVEKYVASVARTDPGNMNDVKICDALQMPVRPAEERLDFMLRFARTMQRQLERHGDKRLESSGAVAAAFSKNSLKQIEAIEAMDGGLLNRMLAFRDVPFDLVDPDMTIGDIGALAVYAKQLAILRENIRPRVPISIRDISPGTLPSYALEQRLSKIQRKAERVSGSDLGDGSIASLAFYADGVEVDKRTCEYLKQVQRTESQLAGLIGPIFRSSDYTRIPDQFV